MPESGGLFSSVTCHDDGLIKDPFLGEPSYRQTVRSVNFPNEMNRIQVEFV